MRTLNPKFSYFLVGTALILSLQGCDQINNIIGYFSPKKTADKMSAPMPVSVTPLSTPAETTTTPSTSEAKADTKATAAVDLPANVLAKVGNWSITINEFKDQEKAAQDLAKQNNLKYDLPSERLLGMIVEQQLLFQEAQRRQMDKDSKISKQIDEARKLILSQTLQTQMVEEIKVTDEDIKKFYEENKQFYFEPAQYRLSQIVVDTEEEANAIFAQVVGGADFAALVQEKSKVKSTETFITDDKMPFPKMKDVVNALDVGKYSTIFKGDSGFYIVKLEEKKGGKERTLEEVKKGIESDLSYLKYLQGLQKLQATIPVQTNLKLLEAK